MTGMVLVSSCARRASSVLGPSISGIITSRRIASGWLLWASNNPADPELAVVTFQSSVISRLRLATSRMCSSSSIMRRCLCGMLVLLFRSRDGLQQMDDLGFEFLQAAPALGQE